MRQMHHRKEDVHRHKEKEDVRRHREKVDVHTGRRRIVHRENENVYMGQ